MAIEKTIEIKTDANGAEKGFEKLAEAIKELNASFEKFSKTTEDGLEDVQKGAENTSKGVKKIGGTLNNLAKGTGVIFLLSKAFEVFKDIASKNQKIVDIFSTSFEVLSIAFNDFFNFIFDNAGGVIDFFKAIFENPLESVKALGRSIKANIIERFESFLDTLGFLSSAIKKVFSGDFKGALEDVKAAGKESIDVITGVNNTFDRASEVVTKVSKAVVDYTTNTFKAAKANVDLAKAAELAAVKNQGLID
jgi:methyl-accepting chemotaxis protein